jgi:hypothetical protein
MTGPRAEMWKTYVFHGLTVMVVQQWNDPFGTPMVRIAETGGEERAEGMPEAVFLSQAAPVTIPKAE